MTETKIQDKDLIDRLNDVPASLAYFTRIFTIVQPNLTTILSANTLLQAIVAATEDLDASKVEEFRGYVDQYNTTIESMQGFLDKSHKVMTEAVTNVVQKMAGEGVALEHSQVVANEMKIAEEAFQEAWVDTVNLIDDLFHEYLAVLDEHGVKPGSEALTNTVQEMNQELYNLAEMEVASRAIN